ncbi:MAG: hypothetical protein HRT71_20425 [Flavobacteriales bacterium]|nr:hypothetical protein [Flavobacteriales bacterium]
MNTIRKSISSIYDRIDQFWDGKPAQKAMSNMLVISFILGFIFYGLTSLEIIQVENEFFKNPFFAIEISFTLLLIMELFSLIFVLPKSVAQANLKQYELLSLIFLRAGFKEFSKIHDMADWSLASEPLRNMFCYGIGGLLIFIIVNYTYKLQKHTRLTLNDDDQIGFIHFKKVLALLLMASFIIIGVLDIISFAQHGENKLAFDSLAYNKSFEAFYTILIFSDIVIVLFALRYSNEYLHIFRYSAFVLATIFIRISFSLKTYESVAIGLGGALFVLLLTVAYNYFVDKNIDSDWDQRN